MRKRFDEVICIHGGVINEGKFDEHAFNDGEVYPCVGWNRIAQIAYSDKRGNAKILDCKIGRNLYPNIYESEKPPLFVMTSWLDEEQKRKWFGETDK